MANIPNFIAGVGRLATSRYDFANHTDGYGFRHNAESINLSPAIVIDGVSKTDTQGAISALNTLVESISGIADATTTTKGIIQLAGDIEGTATNIIVSSIQGYPISNTVPSTTNVLTWNGVSWEPAAANNFIASGDLAGDYSNQLVYNLTGDSGLINIYADNLTFSSSIAPVISQTTTSGAGNDITIQAQNSTGIAKYAGSVIVSGGSNNDGYSGGISLKMRGGTSTLIDIKELAESILDPKRRVISLCSAVDVTNMPNATGDSVVYIGDAVTVPSTGTPANGNILYSQNHHLWIKEESDKHFQLSCYNNIIAVDGYGDGYDITQPNAYFSTSSTSYENMGDDPTILLSDNTEVGDILKISFTGVVKCSDPLFIRAAVRDLAAGTGDEFEYETEISGASICLDNAASKIQVNLSGYMATTEVHSALFFTIQVKSSSGAYVYVYKPFSYIAEVIRTT